jgi:CheY-like chemotaxis protein/HPt (histidine-containing phosphotransfer) domain-containing protein
MTTLVSGGLLIAGLSTTTFLLVALLTWSLWRGRHERDALQAIIADLREHESDLRRQIDAAKVQADPPYPPAGQGVPAPPQAVAKEPPPVLVRQLWPMIEPSNPAPAAQPSGLAILVAEDNPVNRAMALRQLERLGYTADAVINGREAVEAVRRQRYDLILMDLQMPELDGDLATRAIRSLGDSVYQPVIVAITANVMDGDRERCLAAGMDDYLGKPVLIADLRQAISRVAPSAGQIAPPQQASVSAPDVADLIDEASIVVTLDTLSDNYSEALAMLLDLYRNEIPAQMDGLIEAVGLRDRERIRQAAHKLLGGCRQLGATSMASRCTTLERVSPSAPIDDLARQIADIRSCYQATISAVLARFTQADAAL